MCPTGEADDIRASLLTDTGGSSELPTEDGSSLQARKLVAGRYEIHSRLGKGGMGEVWHAYDVKLRVDVALKSLRLDLKSSRDPVEALRGEVRAAREVMSPNVCRIFDLVVEDQQELISMEYIDGITLSGLLSQGPMELRQARDIAAQFLAGLEAIHEAGLVHRDLKPENIMITRTGRVVVMDFGIAKQITQVGGTISGTPPYMAPEQLAGERVDARCDVFSAGVILAEMIHPQGILSQKTREDIWNGLRQQPVQLSDNPWKTVIAHAVAPNPEDRFPSAGALSRALEELTQRVETVEERRPYPGLLAFTAADAEYFFGRELEVETIIKKLQQLHMMALVGTSGAGKTSFLRAGLIPVLPDGWKHIFVVPGDAPLLNLKQALVPEFSGDTEAMQRMLQFDDLNVFLWLLNRWRSKHAETVLIIDRFEELLTLNPEDVRARYAELIGRAAMEADVRVLLSMRDDFLLGCHDYPSLAPIFSELTPLGPLAGAALRRALVQPALKCGYRFEDENLVDEIIADVEKERGALPLMAFAAARLWESRDRQSGMLMRDAYRKSGGVAGALAQHAEETIERIGAERQLIIREIFRNLITAQNTRAARDTEELLSVFEAGPSVPGTSHLVGDEKTQQGTVATREVAEEVLRALIDARLLTSFEAPQAEEETPRRRVEIIHESLLSAWPRLVRWQTQDAGSAQLRDQLRQAAQLWEQRNRSEDLLWTGTAFQEYQLWRNLYAGGLSATEEAFARAMNVRAEGRRRRKRLAIIAVIVFLFSVAATIAVFWLRSETARQKAVAAERQAVATNLWSLARLQPEDEPSAFLAYAIASLERADNPELRRQILEALWRGPTEIRLVAGSQHFVDFSPDGQWLATANADGVTLWPSNGAPPTPLKGSGSSSMARISPRGDVIAHNVAKPWNEQEDMREIKLWSFPDGRFLRTLRFDDATSYFRFSANGDRLFTLSETGQGQSISYTIQSWPVDGSEPQVLGRLNIPSGYWPSIDPTGRLIAWAEGRMANLALFDGSNLDLKPAMSLKHDQDVVYAAIDERGKLMATFSGDIVRIWSLDQDPPELLRTLTGKARVGWLRFDPSGSMIAGSREVWSLAWPAETEPLRALVTTGAIRARKATTWYKRGYGVAIHPQGNWLATGYAGFVSFSPLTIPHPLILRGHTATIRNIAFTSDSQQLVSSSEDGSVRVWPLNIRSGKQARILYQTSDELAIPTRLAVSPDSSFAAIGAPNGQITVLPLDGGPQRRLSGFTSDGWNLAVGPRARLIAATGGLQSLHRAHPIKEESVVRIWDLTNEESRILDVSKSGEIGDLEFTSEGDLWVDTGPTYERWSLSEPTPRLVKKADLAGPEQIGYMVQKVHPDGQQLLFIRVHPSRQERQLWIHDLKEDTSRELTSHGTKVFAATFDPSGETVVSADEAGFMRVGRIDGSEPHLLMGQKEFHGNLVVSPDGRWIASAGSDHKIRLWPMPDLSRPPLHTLPREELIKKLRSLTNFRAVPDPESSTGWKLEVASFPGWKNVPTW